MIPFFLEKGYNVINPVVNVWTVGSADKEKRAIREAEYVFCLLANDSLCIISMLMMMSIRNKNIVIVWAEVDPVYIKKREIDRESDEFPLVSCTRDVNNTRSVLGTYIPGATIVKIGAECLIPNVITVIMKQYS